VSNDPIEKARLAWLGARYRFEQLVRGEPSDEEYRKAKAELERAKQFYEQLSAQDAAR
jgi:hypothetical protein